MRHVHKRPLCAKIFNDCKQENVHGAVAEDSLGVHEEEGGGMTLQTSFPKPYNQLESKQRNTMHCS
jgi:hypothetical protein